VGYNNAGGKNGVNSEIMRIGQEGYYGRIQMQFKGLKTERQRKGSVGMKHYKGAVRGVSLSQLAQRFGTV
jgi:hypothetical protein